MIQYVFTRFTPTYDMALGRNLRCLSCRKKLFIRIYTCMVKVIIKRVATAVIRNDADVGL